MEPCFETNLSNIDLSSIHELQDGSQMLEWNVLEDDDGVLGGVLLQQSLEIGRTSGENHLVSLAALTIASQSHVTE